MALRTAGSVLVVFLWSVAVVLGQDGWSVKYTTQSICVLKGSTVDLTCSFRYPRGKVTSTFWFTKWGTSVEPKDLGQDPEYAGHLEYHGDKKKDCTMRITDLRERDSAEYKFRLLTDQEGGKYSGSPGVTLSVTGIVKVFLCSITISSDSCCGVVGESCMNVTYTHQSICALKGSTVDISCFYTDPSWHNVTEVSWFNKWESGVTKDLSLNPEYADSVKYHRQSEKDSTLRITDLRESDSTEYKFRFTTDKARWGYSFPGTTLTVTGSQVEVTPKWSSESKTLSCITTCTLSNPNPIYIWYRNGQNLDESNSPQYKDPVSSNYDDSYSSAVKGHEDLLSPAVTPAAEGQKTLTYAPKNTSVSVSPSGEIVEGSSVNLTCSSDANPPVDKYTWYKKNVTSPKASGQSYSITNIISEDRGEYYCEAQNGRGSMNSTALMIIVAGKQTSVLTAAVGIIVVVLVVILCLSGLMWFRKTASKPTNTRDTADVGQGDSSPVYDNISNMAMNSTATQTADTENQEDVHYASVYFSGSKNQEVLLYSTVQVSQPQKEDEDVQYAALNFNLPSAATR
ncbi:sialoadhesin-like [Oncorhynchus nerka]|uniref:sialoadhesin-like n=1 Tax=Oncorhynchus nerka TaxID=8023 RepID=UPI0031B85428